MQLAFGVLARGSWGADFRPRFGAEPLLIYPPSLSVSSSGMAAVADIQGPDGSLANFLQDLGPALLNKYDPKAIVVFSAHWETNGGTLVTDYGEENPLLFDCEPLPPLGRRSAKLMPSLLGRG